jgi:5-methylcytosine-specific restriction endonuclease McrA
LREGIYNCEDIEVHHAVKIDDDKDLAFNSSNLITLCREHHRQADEGEISFETIKGIIDEQKAKNANCEAIKEIIDEQEAKSANYEADKLSWCAV